MPENHSLSTRYSLLQRLSKVDDQESWSEFIKRYKNYISNVLTHTGLHHSEVDDLTQVVLIKLVKLMPEERYSKNKGKFRNWLGKVIKNEAYTYLRNRKNRDDLLNKNEAFLREDLFGENDSPSALDEFIESEWEKHLIEEAWNNLSKQLKDPGKSVFELALQGKTTKEIAETMSISPGAVRVYKIRVMESIQGEIKKIEDC